VPGIFPSCADGLEMWEPQTSGTPWGLSMPVMGLLYLLPNEVPSLRTPATSYPVFLLIPYYGSIAQK